METLPCSRTDAARESAALGELGVDDGHLLERFIRERDEPAFAELVRRHGPMVLGVCRRVLDNPHDAEDCFQAVFMVLVRKAESIRPSSMVGNWLYGVAYRTALEARKLAARRRIIEKKKLAAPPAEEGASAWQEMRPVLDRELNRLPDKYRIVLVACDLDGKTRREVAEQLDLPEGTVASRLARARRLLSKRLARYASISAGALGTLLSAQSAAPVPPALVASTAKAAVQLAAGKPVDGTLSPYVAALCDAVVKSMLWTKIQIGLAGGLAILAAIAFCVVAIIPAVQGERKAGGQALAKPDKVKPPQYLRDCVVAKVDNITQKLHVRQAPTPGGNGVPVTYDLVVEPGTQIIIDGKESRLAELREGYAVILEIDANPIGACRARRIEAAGPKVAGIVKGLDKQTLKVSIDDTHLVADAIVADDADVVIDGNKSKLGDVKAGMRVTLQMSAAKEPSFIVGIIAGPKK
jgi:RNA polymerase sigma factor (sigma-70 family)